MKREKDHVVPLSRQALALVDELRLRRNGSEFVFPSDRRIDRPMSENAILYLLHRLGYKGKMTGHGWRSVASTWANENGHPADAIERQLAHSPTDKVRSAYNRAEYLQQRRAMLQEWADWLELREVPSQYSPSSQTLKWISASVPAGQPTMAPSSRLMTGSHEPPFRQGISVPSMSSTPFTQASSQ